MIKGLTEYDKYKVVRPILGDCEYDAYEMPIVRKTPVDTIDWDKLKVIGIQNASAKTSSKDTLVLMFKLRQAAISTLERPLKKDRSVSGICCGRNPRLQYLSYDEC